MLVKLSEREVDSCIEERRLHHCSDVDLNRSISRGLDCFSTSRGKQNRNSPTTVATMATHEQANNDEEAAATSILPFPVDQRVVWNKETAALDLQPTARRPPKHSSSSLDEGTHASPPGLFKSLETQLDDFDLEAMQEAGWSLVQFRAVRIRLYQEILHSASPLTWLPRFVSKWSSALTVFSGNHAGKLSRSDVALCEEFAEVAQAFKSLGEIAEARASLGKCIALTRQCQHQVHEPEHQRLLTDAKELLFACIKFQETFATCEKLMLRMKTPPPILVYLLREIDGLASQAPFSVRILQIKTDLLLKANQYANVVSSLSSSSLTHANARLTLAYARALETLGFYKQSLHAAQVFLASERYKRGASAAAEMQAFTALDAHSARLDLLLDRKRQAEQLQREEKYRDAERCYDDCLLLVDNNSNNHFRAELLYNRADVILMTTAPASANRLPAAILDLTRSLELNPSNQLAKLRMETAQLQLEAEKLKSQMSKKRMALEGQRRAT